MGLARTLERNAITEISDPLFVLIEDFVLLCAEPSRSQTIYRDSVLAPIIGQTHGELSDSSAACSISSEAGVSSHTRYRTYIDDSSVTTRNHAARKRLGHKETPAKICLKNLIPILPCNLQRRFSNVASSVVHQDVEMT